MHYVLTNALSSGVKMMSMDLSFASASLYRSFLRVIFPPDNHAFRVLPVIQKSLNGVLRRKVRWFRSEPGVNVFRLDGDDATVMAC